MINHQQTNFYFYYNRMQRKVKIPRESRSDRTSLNNEAIYDRSLKEVGSPLPLMGELVQPSPGVSLLDLNLMLKQKQETSNKSVSNTPSTKPHHHHRHHYYYCSFSYPSFSLTITYPLSPFYDTSLFHKPRYLQHRA